MFPDASPERPVVLSCPCGGRVALRAPPEDWPIQCPACGARLSRVDSETVGPSPASSGGGGPALLPAVASEPAPPARAEAFPALPAVRPEHPVVAIEGRDFRNRPVRREVSVVPPEVYGTETLAMAFWLAAVIGVMAGHAILTRGEFTAASVLVQSVLFAVVTTAFALIQGHTVRPTLSAGDRVGPWITWALAGIPVSVGFVTLYFHVLREAAPHSTSDPLQDLLRDPASPLPLLLLAIGVLPGFFEELGFRGWMQSTWREIVPPRRALVLTACVFAVVHFSLVSIGWLLPMGLWLGFLRERSGSIWPGVVAHAGHNIGMTLLVRFMA